MYLSVFSRAAAVMLALACASASATIVSSGVAVVTGTYSFDFDAGVEGNFILDDSQDVFWEQFTASTRALVPENGASLINLGHVSFAALTPSDLQGLSFGSSGITGSDVGNVLTFGDVFAVKTTSGNYAKVLVSAPYFDASENHGLVFYYETYSPAVPEPSTLGLSLTGLGAVAWRLRKQGRTSQGVARV